MSSETSLAILAIVSAIIVQLAQLVRWYTQRRVVTRLPGYKVQVVTLAHRQVLIISLVEQESDTSYVAQGDTPITPVTPKSP